MLELLSMSEKCFICRTQQTNDNLQNAADKFSLHADLPFLSQSHHRIWYIWLVISIVGGAPLLTSLSCLLASGLPGSDT